MTAKKISIFKKIATDALGVILLIGAVLFGWLPGPGGVPLLLGGLGLLSINHDWAKKLLDKAKNSGTNLYEFMFPDNKIVYLLYDIVGLVLFSCAIYVISLKTKNITQTVAIAVVFVSLGLLVTNRKRLIKIANFIQKLTKLKH